MARIEVKCRRCRTFLLSEESAVDSHGKPVQDLSKRSCGLTTLGLTHLFISLDHGPPWIAEAIEEQCYTQGKLLCPKCQGRLGSFDFVRFVKPCYCGNTTLPPIHLLTDRVDICDLNARQELTANVVDWRVRLNRNASNQSMGNAAKANAGSTSMENMTSSHGFYGGAISEQECDNQGFSIGASAATSGVATVSIAPVFRQELENSGRGTDFTLSQSMWETVEASPHLLTEALSPSQNTNQKRAGFFVKAFPAPATLVSCDTKYNSGARSKANLLALNLQDSDRNDRNRTSQRRESPSLISRPHEELNSSTLARNNSLPGMSPSVPGLNRPCKKRTARDIEEKSTSHPEAITGEPTVTTQALRTEIEESTQYQMNRFSPLAEDAFYWNGNKDFEFCDEDREVHYEDTELRDQRLDKRKIMIPLAKRRFGLSEMELEQRKREKQEEEERALEGEDVSSELTCPICLEVMLSPHSTLPCRHTFCAECLRRLNSAVSERNHGRCVCPMCRRDIAVCIPNTELEKQIERQCPLHKRQRSKEEKRTRQKLQHVPLPGYRFCTRLQSTVRNLRQVPSTRLIIIFAAVFAIAALAYIGMGISRHVFTVSADLFDGVTERLTGERLWSKFMGMEDRMLNVSCWFVLYLVCSCVVKYMPNFTFTTRHV